MVVTLVYRFFEQQFNSFYNSINQPTFFLNHFLEPSFFFFAYRWINVNRNHSDAFHHRFIVFVFALDIWQDRTIFFVLSLSSLSFIWKTLPLSHNCYFSPISEDDDNVLGTISCSGWKMFRCSDARVKYSSREKSIVSFFEIKRKYLPLTLVIIISKTRHIKMRRQIKTFLLVGTTLHVSFIQYSACWLFSYSKSIRLNFVDSKHSCKSIFFISILKFIFPFTHSAFVICVFVWQCDNDSSEMCHFFNNANTILDIVIVVPVCTHTQ